MPGPIVIANTSDFPLDQAIPDVYFTRVENYILYATATLLIYEILVTFDQEVERVWSLRWRLPKFLFFLNRYVARILLIMNWISSAWPTPSPEFCHLYVYWQAIPSRLAILAAQAVMVIRLWAIYNNSRLMFVVLSTLFAAETAALVGFLSLAIQETQGALDPQPLGCDLRPLSPHLGQYASATWIAPVCFELIIVIITLLKVTPPLPMRYMRRWPILIKMFPLAIGPGNVTLDLLARDSLIYFVLIFALTLANALLYEIAFDSYFRSVLLGPTAAISCIAVSSMIINIRSMHGPAMSEFDTELRQSKTTTAEAGMLVFADSYAADFDVGISPHATSHRPRRSSARGRVTSEVRDEEEDGLESDEYEAYELKEVDGSSAKEV